jgi:3-hydroxybutyryl-CoA dehydrogenase
VTRVAVIGAGTMGHGIAYVCAVAGYDVTLTDANAAALDAALVSIGKSLDSGVARGKLSDDARRQAFARISASLDPDSAVRDAAIVVEAAPEQMTLKQQIFEHVSQIAPAGALLATNTSSLSVSAIASAARSPDRVIGMHFFNPVAAMKLVEIVRGALSSDETVDRARAFAESLGKTSIVVGDSPGFATSRLGVVLGLEAMRMLEQGVASAADIDTAMELGYNHPVGPLRLTDIVGLDVRLAVADHLHASLGDSTYAAPKILRRMVAEGRLGRKTGSGFYDWPAPG